jgi:hypothetical protein
VSIAEKFETIADAVYNKGLSDKELESWDIFTRSFQRINYEYAFYMMAVEYIHPPQKIIVSSGRDIYMFGNCLKLKKIEKQHFDLSKISISTVLSTGAHYSTFYCCYELEEIEDIGLPAGSYYDTFRQCEKLHTIEVLRVTEECQFTPTCFFCCNALKNITIEGLIGKTISFSSSPLSVESIENIIEHLYNYTENPKGLAIPSSTPVITFKASAFNVNSEEWRTQIQAKGWNVTTVV